MKKEKAIWAWFDALSVLTSVLGCAFVLYLSLYRSWYYLFLVPPFLLLFYIGDIGIEETIIRIEKNIKCWKDADAKAKDSKANLHKKGRK